MNTEMLNKRGKNCPEESVEIDFTNEKFQSCFYMHHISERQ